ncbi:MAG: hypothetical protein KY468_13300 [Armatimonadetes bacterium]|nr:hypothetical protein [Armatimonadota bacterium]
MLPLPTDFKEFISLLNAHQVKYPVVGGFAVAFHGYPRMTGDIDFLIEASEENVRKLEGVLGDFGFGGLGLTYEDFISTDTVMQLGYPPHRIDLMTSITGISFMDAWEGKVTLEVEGEPLYFIGKESLLANKAATDRLKDRADLEFLSDESDQN